MIPVGGVPNISLESVIQPSLTWKIDFNRGRIGGMVDGIEAVKQMVFLTLHTERYENAIYSFDYGVELHGLVGKNGAYVRSELSRRISEALMQDKRVKGIEAFDAVIMGDSIAVTFTVLTDFGKFQYSQEVG